MPAFFADRLGYLLKHANLRFTELSDAALAPLGITGRQSALLTAIDDPDGLSQQEVADRVGVDRTSMVALIDELAAKDLVARRPHPADRRKNVVELTPNGRTTLRKARVRTEEVERAFLAPLSATDGKRLRVLLQAVAGQ